MESPFPACGHRAPLQSLGQKNPGSPWESSPAAAGDTEATGAGAGSCGAMIHILRKGPHPPTRQPRSCFVERKVPSTPLGLPLALENVGAEDPWHEAPGLGLQEARKTSCFQQKAKPQLPNCRGPGQKPAAIARPGALHQSTLPCAHRAGRL